MGRPSIAPEMLLRAMLLQLAPTTDHHVLQSAKAPEEPHQFDAALLLKAGEARDALPFRMDEPDEHQH